MQQIAQPPSNQCHRFNTWMVAAFLAKTPNSNMAQSTTCRMHIPPISANKAATKVQKNYSSKSKHYTMLTLHPL
ncbi:hypothetical protein E2C01_005839 [Portunus trituberculatus]|uniref:Uncharacterized protein n=1 Tax=Portunus trituberculatus TaxID=210409 RepID=A0A5B7CUI4_PORTR|nr:hypothetical protein [Portunus trituberculatus]